MNFNVRLMGGANGYTGGTLPYGLTLLVRDLFEKVTSLSKRWAALDGVPVRNRLGARGKKKQAKPMVDGGGKIKTDVNVTGK